MENAEQKAKRVFNEVLNSNLNRFKAMAQDNALHYLTVGCNLNLEVLSENQIRQLAVNFFRLQLQERSTEMAKTCLANFF